MGHITHYRLDPYQCFAFAFPFLGHLLVGSLHVRKMKYGRTRFSRIWLMDHFHASEDAAIPRIRTGMSRFDTPRCSKSQTNCSKYETPVDM